MNNKKTKRNLTMFGMLAMAAGTVVPLNVLATKPGGGARDFLSGDVNPDSAEAKVTSQKTTITVQKLQYKKDAPINVKKGVKEDGSDTVGINNNGKEVTDFKKYNLEKTNVENFNKAKYGDVQFSVFKLTKAGLEQDTKGNGNLKYNDKDVNGYFEAVEGMQNISVDNAGKVEFKDLPQGVYFIVETKHSKNLVVTPAEDMRVDLPRTNNAGDGYENHLFLYPKNRVKDFTFTLTKFGEDFSKTKERLGVKYKDTTVKLEGITFELYKGEPGKGTKVGGDLLTNKDGQISVSENLTVGKYYFVEKAKDKVVGNTDDDQDAEYILSPYAQNDENNKMTFSITEEGDIVTDMSLINYGKPHADKKLADEKKDTVVERGQEIGFNSLVKVPKDIAGIAANGTDRGAAPYFSFRYEDTLVTNLEFPGTKEVEDLTASDIKLVVKEAGKKDEEALVTGTDYNVKFEKGKFVIDFIVNTKGKEQDETVWKKSADSKVSTKVKELAGKNIEVSYILVANKDAKAGDKFVNHMDFFYNNQPTSDKDRVIKDETTSRTLGHKIVKVAAGPFGQGKDSDKKLQDAKFILIRNIGTQEKEDLEYFAGTIDTAGIKSIPVWKKLVGVTSEDDTKLDDRALHEKYIEAAKDAYQFTTGEDGSVTFDGLDNDLKYFVKEVKAPAGYQLIPGKIELKDISDKYENKKYIMGSQEIVDKKSPEMPLTGSEKMLIGLGVTVTITLLAGGYAVIQKKNNKIIDVE